MEKKALLFDSDATSAAIARIADAVVHDFKTGELEDFAFVGIYENGVPLAERLAVEVEKRCGYHPVAAKLDISMYRDDVGMRSGLPLIRETVIPFEMNAAKVVLVDDVLSSGRTIRAALDAVTDYGRPALIYLAVLVDRGRTEYPIHADYAGLTAPEVSPKRKIRVEFAEDGSCEVHTVDWGRKHRTA
ncbi:MAG: bifunctional pyr operon transcriptional regulator/uracil phosphoribosyltransferase PyrR [Victivallaceae bacterium]|nr:bifunctional pyr operon transcriptional regulator/uracil phosphoribosyltransferase PyrR [Victivallaceae bacterium]